MEQQRKNNLDVYNVCASNLWNFKFVYSNWKFNLNNNNKRKDYVMTAFLKADMENKAKKLKEYLKRNKKKLARLSKIYREENKERIRVMRKNNRLKNRDKINVKQRERYKLKRIKENENL